MDMVTSMTGKFTWIPFYKELAKALLRYRDNRRPLVDWIYQEIGAVTRTGNKTLVDYLHMRDKSPITDIDPFSVYAIFNRKLKYANKRKILEKFKEHFAIVAALPIDFEGIPIFDARRAFFFSWDEGNEKKINDMWMLFSKVVNNQDCEEEYNKVLENGMPAYSLTMLLFYINPEHFLSLDVLNRVYLCTVGFPDKYPSLSYKSYYGLMEKVRYKMGKGDIPYQSFPELSLNSWEKRAQLLNISMQTVVTDKYEDYISLLKANKNLVLTGAPGTGKTYLAHRIAEAMGAETRFVQFHPSYDYTDFVEGLRPVDTDGTIGFERKDGVFKAFCKEAIRNIQDSEKSIDQLSEERSWQERLSDFVDEAIEKKKKFKTVNGSEFVITDQREHSLVMYNEQNEKASKIYLNADEILILLKNDVPLNIVKDIWKYFHRKNGWQEDSYIFAIIKAIRAEKRQVAVEKVSKVERKNFVFIIDEINRGEASKIFGELFYAIDPGYRVVAGDEEDVKSKRVDTQYQNLVPESDVFSKGFYVPDNVYILATMNDIDRSVESMDFAMRRRFTWKEVRPEDTATMFDGLDCAEDAKETMTRLNEVIAKTEELGAAYMIGPAYFLKLEGYNGDFERLWQLNIEPLLKEYLRGFRKADELLEKFRRAYFNEAEGTGNEA